MHRFVHLVALSGIVVSASLLLRAQPLTPPTPPANDPFGAAAPVPGEQPPVDPFAPAPAVDPFAVPAAAPGQQPQADPFGAAPHTEPALPPATPVVNAALPIHRQPEFVAWSFAINIYKRSFAYELNPLDCEIVFADESLGIQILQKMTPGERMAYHLDRPALFKRLGGTYKLADLVHELSRRLQVNVEIDVKAFEQAAYDPATPMDFEMVHAANLGATLRRLLRSFGLEYLRLNDTLLITTSSTCEETCFIKTYNLDRELFRSPLALNDKIPQKALAAGGGYGGGGPAGGGLGGNAGGSFGYTVARTEDDDAEYLLTKLVELVEPTSWKHNGGHGELHMDLKKSILVVRNAQPIHDEIAVVLADLRKSLQSQRTAVLANAQLERRVVHGVKIPLKIIGKDAQFKEFEIAGTEPLFTMQELADLIKQQVEPHTWKDEKHTLSILGENLIINQTEATQTKIRNFLRELKITREQYEENNRSFQGAS